jgi:peptidyl-Lys metalloendopeptidase
MLFLAFLVVVTAVPDGATYNMAQVPATGLAQGVSLRIAVVTDKQEVLFDKANSPMEPLLGDILSVVDSNGERLPYLGAVARRSEAFTATVTIPAADELVNIIDLTDSYDIQEHSNYTVTYESASTMVVVGELIPTVKERDGKPHPPPRHNQKFACNPTSHRCEFAFDIGTDYASCEKICGGPAPQSGCSSTQVSQTSSAESQAGTQISRARSSLSQGSTNLYSTWFGAYSSSNLNTLSSDFSAMGSALTKSRYTCNGASCSNNVYAYVFPSDSSQTIYLCNVFWQLPQERAETIVHELSHFTRLAGTNDYTYGRSSCQSLARSNPRNAIRNADNQCYFGADA